MKPKLRDTLLFVFVGALLAAMACNNLLTRGMFMDGLIYTSVAENMARGVGDIWHMQFTPTRIPEFYGHPPLMMALLAGWFRLFGCGMMQAKGYSVVVVMLTAWLMVAIGRLMGYPRRMGWLVLLLWVLVPGVALGVHNNYLESTMTLFVLGAVWCVWRGSGVGWSLLGGLMLALAFLTKGPTGLFPLALPCLLLMFGLRQGVVRAAISTLAMVLGLVTPLVLIYWSVPGAREFAGEYWTQQIVEGMRTEVSSRWYIVGVWLSRIGIVVGLTVASLIVGRKGAAVSRRDWQVAGAMLALSLCGTLPMMLSIKQRAFYLLTVYPIVALGLGALMIPTVGQWSDRVKGRWVVVATGMMVAVAIVLNVWHCGRPGRDVAKIEDLDLIAPVLDEGEWLTSVPELWTDYSLHGYYHLRKHIVLDADQKHRYLLTTVANGVPRGEEQAWEKVALGTQKYELYARMEE